MALGCLCSMLEKPNRHVRSVEMCDLNLRGVRLCVRVRVHVCVRAWVRACDNIHMSLYFV